MWPILTCFKVLLKYTCHQDDLKAVSSQGREIHSPPPTPCSSTSGVWVAGEAEGTSRLGRVASSFCESKPKKVPRCCWFFDLLLPIFRTLLSNILCPTAMTFYDTLLLVVILGIIFLSQSITTARINVWGRSAQVLAWKSTQSTCSHRRVKSWCTKDRYIIHIFSHQSILEGLLHGVDTTTSQDSII